MTEEAVQFGAMSSLVGIVTDAAEPEKGRNLPAVILLNAGLFHRVGPNRLYVKMARTLAVLGFVVLRFDVSGIGDSTVRADSMPFAQSVVNETQEAMTYLQQARGMERFVLIGICSGGEAAFHLACRDARVVGAVVINAREHLHGANAARTAAIRHQALMRHYCRIIFRSSFRAKNWLKALTGQGDIRRVILALKGVQLSRLFTPKRPMSGDAYEVGAEVAALGERGVRLLHVYAEGDEGLDYFRVMLGDQRQKRNAHESFKMEMIHGANHTFTLLWSQEHLLNVIHRWAQAMAPD